MKLGHGKAKRLASSSIFATALFFGMMLGPSASATHNLPGSSDRDGYDFYYYDGLNSRGNVNAMTYWVGQRGYDVGHNSSNGTSISAYTNLNHGVPYIYYHTGHSYYYFGGPPDGFVAQMFETTSRYESALANDAAENAIVEVNVDSFDVTAATLSVMKLAVLQGCKTAIADMNFTSPAHAFYRAGTGSDAALGFTSETYYSVGSTDSDGPDYVWAEEFFHRMRNTGVHVSTAAYYAKEKVYQSYGTYYGYDTWYLVGENITLPDV